MPIYTYWKTPSTNVLRRVNGLVVDIWFMEGSWRCSMLDIVGVQRTSIQISENDAKKQFPEAFK